ncbi:LOW QUALITY PROTEIN: F-box only protein 30 [Boleophthalmus pectinirostris]|uniref:LOW QUALITY PROTEIN: F-box only protein 30 n=1 Tax=Boleophthalmus pectinirostris TaxID=150288 RepID=UPI00242F875C|nr:LOW QUALITY PROTEIN: F-box only protein 30 [Boleophthalmus pectinirostris]
MMILDSSVSQMEEHAHCVSCFNLRCSVRPEPGLSCELVPCALVPCALLCGAVFHSCKSQEHQILCPLLKVPCINSTYGCPVSLIRDQMSAHLEVCPAGVVCCTMEWNRWPVSCLNYTSYESLSNATEEVEQLDMALALQDQRTLLESLKVISVAPTVEKDTPPPIVKENISTDAESRPPSTSEKIARGINGMNEEHFSKLYQATVETARSLAAALEFVSNSSSAEIVNNGAVEQAIIMNSNGIKSKTPVVSNVLCTKSAEPDICSNLSDLNEPQNDTDLILNTANGQTFGGLGKHSDTSCTSELQKNASVLQDSLATGQNQDTTSNANHVIGPLETHGVNFYRKHLLLTQGQCSMPFSQISLRPSDQRPEMEDKSVDTSDLEQQEDPMGLGDIDLITAALFFCLEESRECRRISDTVYVDGFRVDFGTQTFTFPAAILVTNTRVGDMASASACDHAASQLSYPNPYHTLRLGLVLEALEGDVAAFNRYLPSNPRHQHTFPFVCGQSFRRDQFSSHFTNVHGDIHAGLNGWMEHRCPLAYYGCSFSQRRFYPSNVEAKVVHDRYLKSFGVQPCPRVTPPSASQVVQFSELPIEILWLIAGFLDSFSLCQLSLVSRTMRDVCASLLQSRGIVELRWQRRHHPGSVSVSWQVKNKVWRFSTAFSPVSSWGFTNVPSMSDHLKKCTFNTVEHKTDPIPLTAMCTERDGQSLRRTLRHINI